MLALILCLLFQTASFTTAQATCGAKPQPQKSTIDADELLARRFVPWMVKVRELAPQYGYRIEKDDEAWEEWFWLYYYLEGYSPRAALVATRKYDRLRGRTVALVFQDQSVIVSVTEAEKDLARLDKVRRRTLEQEKHHAALVQALGVRPLNDLLACADKDPNRHQPLCETIRGRRLPLQRN